MVTFPTDWEMWPINRNNRCTQGWFTGYQRHQLINAHIIAINRCFFYLCFRSAAKKHCEKAIGCANVRHFTRFLQIMNVYSIADLIISTFHSTDWINCSKSVLKRERRSHTAIGEAEKGNILFLFHYVRAFAFLFAFF